jgi:glycosyltransferase involved in cell wall biosynthesis
MRRERRILYAQYTNPANYPPLQHSSRLLADEGWDVRFLGIDSAGAALRLVPHARIAATTLKYVPPGAWQKVHFASFSARVVGAVLRWRPRWLYASDLWSCPAALVAANLGCPVIYHEHDEPAARNTSSFVRMCLHARARLAAQARACIIPNESRRLRFAEQHPGARTLRVWNCPARAEVQPAREPDPAGEFVLHYHGTIGAPLIPETLLHALGLLPSSIGLHVFGYETMGSRGYAEHLRQLARALGLERRVLIHGPVQRAELWSQMRVAEVGISLSPLCGTDANLLALAGASNKTFDYLAAGLALLISQRTDWTELFGAFGEACDPADAASVAAAIQRLYTERAATRARGEAGRRRVLQEWNYERQFEPVRMVLNG